MSGNVSYRIRLLFSTLSLIEAENPVLLEGETWTEKDAATGHSTGRRKVGDGVTAFTSLPFEPGGTGGGSGDVEGPASSVDGRAALFDGTTGKLLRQSSAAPVLEGDSRLSNSRTPTGHAASHGSAGSDAITVAQSQVTGLGTALAGKADTSGTPSAGQAAEWASGTAITGVATTGTGSYVKSDGGTLNLPLFSTQATVTAGTNAQGQGALTADINVVTTAAANPSGVTLPSATPGRVVTVANAGANNINVYPTSGVAIDARAVNASDLIRVGFTRTYFCVTTGLWRSSAEQTALSTIAGFGTGVAAALAIATGSAGAPVLFNGAGGTPTSLTLTNATGLPTSGITNFNADARAQIEAALVQGTNITITPSGSGATRQLTIAAAGGGGATNLSIANRGTTTLDVASDTGTDATIPAATTSLTGLLTSADKTKLDGIATGATANATDAALRDRATHTGTQGVATITGLGGLATLSALGNITSAGAIGSTANLPVITTTGGALTVGSFGTTANTFCQGNDSRLSDARTPLSHTHGNITNAGAIGSTANIPIITGTGGVLQAGSFGTTANTFAQGNDSRFHDSVTLAASLSPVLSITGQALGAVDHGADRLLFWDDSAGTLAPLELGTNLSITGTTLNATGGGGSLTVQDEGVTLSTSVTTINITGGGATATGSGTVTIDIPGGGDFATIAAGLGQFAEDSTTAGDLQFVLTAAAQTGTGAVYFQGGDLGTPSAGSLGSCTNYSAANLTGNLAIARFNGGTGASSSTVWHGDGVWRVPSGGSLSDGDKGDITVSSAGSVWRIDNEPLDELASTMLATQLVPPPF